ncbi:hypothetical protein PTTG_11930 [Puccinia triticina 1-1 BBBD Race 1]|uniref:Armadillo repeat-containing protein 8 n=1 Tax=Puccinia triticina (isolate 1-1 / race 1 (BBBD)) TaxID=630390 RepID=A0A180H224_PUCT1|nr:hypothetical protein PTTG_11930 [Puccinia triticina 1-1 BBBD Race 1]
MTLTPYSLSLSEQLQDSYSQLWTALRHEFERFKPTSPNEDDTRLLLDRLRSIRNYLVGSKARKSFTTTDPAISRELNLLASVLEWDCLDSSIIKLKVEAAAIVGLLSIPEDQAVLVLLQAGLPSVIIGSITRLLTQIPIHSLLSSQGPPRLGEQHLLQTLLRTLSSLYSIIQDVSSPRKWGFMTKSPERVHLPRDRRSYPASVRQNPFDHQDGNKPAKIDLKGKAKAPTGSEGNAHLKSSTIQVDEPATFDFWPTSKPNKLKEACEDAKTLLSNYIAHGNILIPFVLTISQRSLPDGSPITLSSVSLAALVVPCFQLIWLLCKDTRRQIWLVRKLIQAEDPQGHEDSCLRALSNCLKAWLYSHHDLATEFAIRTIGALLSIHEPPHYSQDYELLEYLDQLVWTQSATSSALSAYTHPDSPALSHLQECGVGWILTCRSERGSPILRSALATSIVSLVKHFPDIRLRILLLQIHHTIELIDNASHSIDVRSEAAYALAHTLTISESLHYEAYEANAIPVLKKLIDKASIDPLPYPTPAFVTQSAMLRESAYLALASLMSTLDAPRKQVIATNLLPGIVQSLSDPSILVRSASCQCCRALSRAMSIVRTNLTDEGAGSRLFDLAFGLETRRDHSALDALLEDDDDDDLDEDAVEIQLKIIAMGALCNLVLEFSPMKNEVLNRNGIEKFIKLLKSSKYKSLREAALWGLKNIIFSSSYQLKLRVIMCLGWDEIFKCLNDKNLSIQENMISFLRNLACGEISDIEIIFKQLTNTNIENTHPPLTEVLEEKLTWSSSTSGPMNTSTTDTGAPPMQSRQISVINDSSKEQILIQTIYTFSNIATGNLTHKTFILERPLVMKAVLAALSHPNPDVQSAAIWCIINLTYFDEDTKPKVIMDTIGIIEELGIPEKLHEILRDFKSSDDHHSKSYNNSGSKKGDQEAAADGAQYGQASYQRHQDSAAKKFQVKDRAECALVQIMRTKDKLHC